MRRHSFLQRLLTCALTVASVAILLGQALPHEHTSALSQHAQSCRICKIHESLSAMPAVAQPVVKPVQPLFAVLAPRRVAPPAHAVVLLAESRAPPVAS